MAHRHGVSELYAAMLMIGVTLSLGSVVVAAAVGQFGLASDSASLGSSLSQDLAGTQLSLVYSAVEPSASCPAFGGAQEGTLLSVALYDYGSEAFSPSGFVVNSTVHQGPYASAPPGALTVYTIQLSACAHQSGEAILAYDARGAVVQFET